MDDGNMQSIEINSTSDDENTSQKNFDSKAYLILDNDADKENIYLGDYVTWIVSVLNIGPDAAQNVKIYDQLPEGMEYVGHTASRGTFNPQTGIWDIGVLAVGDDEVFLNITTQALTVGEKINRAYLTTDTLNLNANNSFEEEEIDVFGYSANAESSSKSVHDNNSTGNPLALLALSLFGLGFPLFRKHNE